MRMGRGIVGVWGRGKAGGRVVPPPVAVGAPGACSGRRRGVLAASAGAGAGGGRPGRAVSAGWHRDPAWRADRKDPAMLQDQAIFVTQLVTLWAVLDPISHLPLFIGATAGLDAAERRRAATIACIMAFVVLAAFGLAGKFLLHAMGISLLSFQIAGGLVLFVFAVSMVLGKAAVQARTDAPPDGPAVPRGDAVMAIAVHPLATPIIAGPGAMLTMVLLIDNNRFSVLDQAYTILAL